MGHPLCVKLIARMNSVHDFSKQVTVIASFAAVLTVCCGQITYELTML